MSSADPELLAAAGALAGAAPREMVPCAAGGNNRVFRLTTERGRFALKVYRRSSVDPRDRLGAEFAGLRYAARVAPGSVPEAIASDHERGLALYEWIDGDPVGDAGVAEIDAAVAFVDALERGRGREGLEALGPASEAILAPADLREQIDRRLSALEAVTGEPALAKVLRDRLAPAFRRLAPALAELRAPAAGERTLSPSDFGFHNALRRNGRLVFIDFEYFGWDDPVKLVCDFVWHPAMRLGEAERARFVTGTTAVFGDRPGFGDRMRVYEPLIALRWAAIVLGEFLPEVRERRAFAGRDAGRGPEAILRGQLAKAEAILDRLAGSPAP